MGLPQELVDYIVGFLCGDFQTLTTFLLTCKSMFASTQPLIHETLRLTRQNNESILTQKQKKELCQKSGHHELHFMSHMAEHSLLQYTQQLDIRDPVISTPDNLLPHLHHFQSLTPVHTLTIWFYDIVKWANHYRTCFAHFYPTLTSLTLLHPFGPYRAIMQFALQFPKLKNLCTDWLREGGVLDPTTVITDQSPPLCGHLRLVGDVTTAGWPGSLDLAYELLGSFNFRSVELKTFSGDRV